MTDALLRRLRPAVTIAPLHRRELVAAHRLCAENPVAYVMPLQFVESALATGRPRGDGLWAVHARGNGDRELVGVMWAGANLVPAMPAATPELLAEVGDLMPRRMRRPSAVVGEAHVIRALWEHADRSWGPARSIRDPQVLMSIDRGTTPVPEPDLPDVELEPVRRSSQADYAKLLPAAVDMFMGEVGYNPLVASRGPYEERLHWLIESGRSFIQWGTVDGERRVVFKAEVGALSSGSAAGLPAGHPIPPGVAELQGVWVHRSMRGRGIGKSSVAQTVALVRERLAPVVSLYANDYNTSALRVYDQLGFARVGEFVSVMM